MKRLPSLLLGLLLSAFASAQTVPEPLVSHSTYLGGDGRDYATDTGLAVARGVDGAVYVLGQTSSSPFPHTATIGPQTEGYGTFVTKFTADGRGIVYSTFIGGMGGRSLAVDSLGNVYVTGETGGSLPGESSMQPFGGSFDAFVLKLNPAGDAVVYATYLGGADLELGRGIAVDDTGAAYVVGLTTSTNFPATSGAAQTQIGGNYDAFVAKLAPDGKSLAYATYVGGTRSESGAALALDGQRRVTLAGRTTSTNFASFASPKRFGQQTGNGDAYVARLSADGTTLQALALLDGGEADAAAAVVLAADGSPVVMGDTESAALPVTAGVYQAAYRGARDLFVVRLTPAFDALTFCTYLGSTALESASSGQYVGGYFVGSQYVEGIFLTTEAGGVALDAGGNVLVAAMTGASAWPDAEAVGPGSTEALVAKLAADGSSLTWLSLLGGLGDDFALGLAGDGQGGAWVTGTADRPLLAPYFPTTPDATQPRFGGGINDGFVTRLSGPGGVAGNNAFGQAGRLIGSRITVHSDNAGATKEPGEPAHGGNAGGASLWWNWTAPASGRLTVSTEGSAVDTLLAVYTGDTLAALTPVAQDDNATAEVTTSRARFPVIAGVTYRIAVDGSGGAMGALLLHLTFSGPPNDDFANRTVLAGFPVTVTGSSVNATAENRSDTAQAGVPGGQSVWWEWTSTTNGFVAISTSGSDFNTTLGVFTGDALDALTEVKSNDNISQQAGAFTSQVTFQASAGTRYLIAVDGYYSQAGAIQLSILPGDPPPNDNFASRALLEGFFARVTASNVNATFEDAAGEPALTFTNSLGEFTEPPAGYSVWWTWTAPTNGRVRLSTEDITFDTRIAVFAGGVPLGELVRVAANNNRGTSFQDLSSLLEFAAVAGRTYEIALDGGLYNGHSGRFTLVLALERPPRIQVPGVSFTAEGNLTLTVIEALPGFSYRLEGAPDFTAWAPLQTLTATAVEFPLTVPAAAASANRFFRVIGLGELPP